MAFQNKIYSYLNKGINLRGFTGGINMIPGQSFDALDMLPLEDGGFMKHWGFDRVNHTALTGLPLAHMGFAYRGKNVDITAAETARGGHFGIADTGADFTKRAEQYTGAVVLTDSTFYRFEPDGETFQTVRSGRNPKGPIKASGEPAGRGLSPTRQGPTCRVV